MSYTNNMSMIEISIESLRNAQYVAAVLKKAADDSAAIAEQAFKESIVAAQYADYAETVYLASTAVKVAEYALDETTTQRYPYSHLAVSIN